MWAIKNSGSQAAISFRDCLKLSNACVKSPVSASNSLEDRSSSCATASTPRAVRTSDACVYHLCCVSTPCDLPSKKNYCLPESISAALVPASGFFYGI